MFCYCRVRLQGFAILIGCNQNMARHLYQCPLSLHHHTHLNHYTGMSILSMNEEMRRLFFDILSRSFILFYIFPFMSAILYPLPRLLPSFLHYLYLLCWLADTPTDRGKKSPKNYIILKPSKNYFSSSSSHKNWQHFLKMKKAKVWKGQTETNRTCRTFPQPSEIERLMHYLNF